MIGSGETDFGPQIEKLNKKLFTVVAWDPRGYGHSRPPDRDFPVDFFERDAKDAVDLMKVGLGEELRGGRRLLSSFCFCLLFLQLCLLWAFKGFREMQRGKCLETLLPGFEALLFWAALLRI